jgi:uncharacterized protein
MSLEDAGREMKARLRADLRTAMKDGHSLAVKVIRTLVAAIDNAEAPPIHTGQAASIQHQFHCGSAEIERLRMSTSDVHRVLAAEIYERERVAAEFERLDQRHHAEALRAEGRLIRRYLE